jgi:hypothetical protein
MIPNKSAENRIGQNWAKKDFVIPVMQAFEGHEFVKFLGQMFKLKFSSIFGSQIAIKFKAWISRWSII